MTQEKPRKNLEQYFDFDGRHDYGETLKLEELVVTDKMVSPDVGRIQVGKFYFRTYGKKEGEVANLLEIGKKYLFIYPVNSYYKRVLLILDVC